MLGSAAANGEKVRGSGRERFFLLSIPKGIDCFSLISRTAPSTLIAGSQGRPEVKAESSEERPKEGGAIREAEVPWKEFIVLNQVDT